MLRTRVLEYPIQCLLNLNFSKRTKSIAFADYLVLAGSGETSSEAENFTNIDICKVVSWGKVDKICLNEEKSKVILISKRKRKEGKEILIYLNGRALEQVCSMKYIRYHHQR